MNVLNNAELHTLKEYILCFYHNLIFFNCLLKRGKFDEKQYISMVMKELLLQRKQYYDGDDRTTP